MEKSDIAFMILCMGLVLLMTPALAFFYGGLVRSKNALNTMMMSFAALGVVGILWAMGGYSLAFSEGGKLIGGIRNVLLNDVDLQPKGAIPHLLFMAYQGTFAVITAALVSGAIVERMRFSAYAVFIGAWSVVVYAPIAHWVWGGGWLSTMGALDFAGGTVVHVNAAVAALVAALVLGPRRDHGRQAFLPHSVPLVLLGTGLLWFGWLGFNGGSALQASNVAALASVNTILAPMSTALVWMLLDWIRTRRVTAVGIATGIVVGLVAITPACGYVGPRSAMVIGAIAAIPSYYGIQWRSRTRLDDSLDVTPAHGLGGIVGALLTGVFAREEWGGFNGALNGKPSQLWIQAVGVGATILYSGAASFILLKAIGLVMPLRPHEREESIGLDVWEHGEEAYSSGEGAILILSDDGGKR
jgi:Amt family ammonium transporter